MGGLGAEWADAVQQSRWDDLGRLLDDHFFASLLQDPAMVRTALASTPDDWWECNPRHLNSRSQIAAIEGRLGTFEGRARQEFSSWVDGQECPATRDCLRILTTEIKWLLALGRFAQADALVDTVWTVLDNGMDTAGLQEMLPSVFILCGTTKLVMRDPEESIVFFEEALRWSSGWVKHPAEGHARNYLALAYALNSDHRRAAANITDWAGTRRSAARNAWLYL